MFHQDDTIVAIATPAGRGGIGVVRLSGPQALRIGACLARREQPLAPRHATLTRVHGSNGMADQAVVTAFPAPHSYTGEDVVELSAHGSPPLLRSIVQAALEAGARLAEPGEFTLRAYLNQRIDLVQAEAVRDLVDAVTPLQARAAFDQLEGTLTGRIREIDARLLDLTARLEASLDFPDEGYHFVEREAASSELQDIGAMLRRLLSDAGRGRLIRDGAQAVILGRPNSGKSSLFNLLAGAERAIVTAIPGTTRDLVTEVVDVDGVPLTLIDTAGIREIAGDDVETEGIARSRGAQAVADIAIVVLDGSSPLTAEDHHVLALTGGRPRVVVANKADLPAVWTAESIDAGPVLSVSALTGLNADGLRSAIAAALAGDQVARDTPSITNVRHVALLERAEAALARAATAASAGTPEEFVVLDLNEARAALEEVTGARTPEDVLRVIFDKFCIGK